MPEKLRLIEGVARPVSHLRQLWLEHLASLALFVVHPKSLALLGEG
jgi:hypothetical protein